MKHRCPVCHKTVNGMTQERAGRAEFFPFCSQRCKLIDLGAWLDSEYKIISKPQSQKRESDKASEKNYIGKFVLRITAHDDTWMKIIIDNWDPREYDLESGEHLELEASSNFNLLIGNAEGVRIRLNDKSIPISAKSGEMLNLSLP